MSALQISILHPVHIMQLEKTLMKTISFAQDQTMIYLFSSPHQLTQERVSSATLIENKGKKEIFGTERKKDEEKEKEYSI